MDIIKKELCSKDGIFRVVICRVSPSHVVWKARFQSVPIILPIINSNVKYLFLYGKQVLLYKLSIFQYAYISSSYISFQNHHRVLPIGRPFSNTKRQILNIGCLYDIFLEILLEATRVLYIEQVFQNRNLGGQKKSFQQMYKMI